MIRITFEAPDREALINSIAQFMLDENHTPGCNKAPAPINYAVPTSEPEAAEPEADEPESAMPTAPKADEQPECGISKEAVREALIDVRSHPKLGASVLRELLKGYDASNINELDPKDYPAIMTAANEMLKEAKNNG